jgi:NADPH:quinone reductase-like Zn-dependent oxidoreductase
VLPVPGGVSLADAAALPEVACTVWSNVFAIGRLEAGDSLLVHGAASGVGTFAVQLAHAVGATVYGTARAAKHEAVRALGADVLVDYTTADFVPAVREATDGRGVDVVLDIIGAKYLARNIDVLAPGGRLLVIGLQGGITAELNLGALMGKRGSIAANTLRARPVAEKAGIVAAVRDHVWPLIADGKVRPVIDRVLPITEAAEAHRIVEANEHVGKVVLTVRS